MILILKHGADAPALCALLQQKYPLHATPIVGDEETIIGLIGDTSLIPPAELEALPPVARVIKIQEPYKRANRAFHPADTLIPLGPLTIGGPRVVICAGPCSVESPDQILHIAASVRDAGATLLRGGAFKPRSSPYAFQGLKAEGLLHLRAAGRATHLPVVSEITNANQLELFLDFTDIIQVGARNMQNFELLRLLGRTTKPILLKRGFSNSLDELLMSAEYILSGGNPHVILCERGIRTFETSTRNTLDISAVPVLKSRSHLPVFVDPSHAAGASWLVPALSKAALAAGADGLLIEVHNDPPSALSDGKQSLTPPAFASLLQTLKPLAAALGREI